MPISLIGNYLNNDQYLTSNMKAILCNACMCITAAVIATTTTSVGAFRSLSLKQQQQRWHISNHRNNHQLFSSSFYLSSLSSTSSSSSSSSIAGIRRNEMNRNTTTTTKKSMTTANESLEEIQQIATTTHPSSSVQTTAVVTPKKKNLSNKSPVAVATTIEELLNIMNGYSDTDNENIDNDSSSSSSMTLILFHANYCKICQRAAMQLNRAAKEYPSVNIAKVEASIFPNPDSAEKLRSLGISKFPFVQIYRNGQCVASFSTGPTHMFMRKVRDTLDLCLGRDDICWDNFVTEFTVDIQSNQLARNNLLLLDDEEQQLLP